MQCRGRECRRLLGRPALRYILVAVYLLNFCLTVVFFHWIHYRAINWQLAESTAGSMQNLNGPIAKNNTTITIGRLEDPTNVTLLQLYEAKAAEPTILNWHLLKNDVNVIVAVQIHNRASYLAYLFESFRQVPDWNHTVIVLSHDFYSPEINALIENCTFAPIIDMYYPASNQIYRDRFPGDDPKDCNRNLSLESARKQGCYNANYSDTYGHYRETKYTQMKHHWIWKLHWVFDEIIPKKVPSFNGQVLLLEEDFYIAPDFLAVLRQAWKLGGANCHIIALGNGGDMQFSDSANRFVPSKWFSTIMMGISLTNSTWQFIKSCLRDFCDFDDYNWDWSLQFTSIKCLERNLHTLKARASRIFHVGDCGGVHFKAGGCVVEKKVKSIRQKLVDNAASLFPAALSIEKDVAAISIEAPNPNGGFSDPRDRALCRVLATGSYADISNTVSRTQTDPIDSLFAVM